MCPKGTVSNSYSLDPGGAGPGASCQGRRSRNWRIYRYMNDYLNNSPAEKFHDSGTILQSIIYFPWWQLCRGLSLKRVFLSSQVPLLLLHYPPSATSLSQVQKGPASALATPTQCGWQTLLDLSATIQWDPNNVVWSRSCSCPGRSTSYPLKEMQICFHTIARSSDALFLNPTTPIVLQKPGVY